MSATASGTKKRALKRARFYLDEMICLLHDRDLLCLGPFDTLYDIKGNLLSLREGPVPAAVNRGIVHKNVFATIDFDEAVAFSGVEPLDFADN